LIGEKSLKIIALFLQIILSISCHELVFTFLSSFISFNFSNYWLFLSQVFIFYRFFLLLMLNIISAFSSYYFPPLILFTCVNNTLLVSIFHLYEYNPLHLFIHLTHALPLLEKLMLNLGFWGNLSDNLQLAKKFVYNFISF